MILSEGKPDLALGTLDGSVGKSICVERSTCACGFLAVAVRAARGAQRPRWRGCLLRPGRGIAGSACFPPVVPSWMYPVDLVFHVTCLGFLCTACLVTCLHVSAEEF